MSNTKRVFKMHRFCPTDEILAEYVSGCLTEKEREGLEVHLADCVRCRKLICETYELLKQKKHRVFSRKIVGIFKREIWGITSLLMFLCSFFVPRYFFQFLSGGILLGLKWISCSINARTLMILRDTFSGKVPEDSDRFCVDKAKK